MGFAVNPLGRQRSQVETLVAASRPEADVDRVLPISTQTKNELTTATFSVENGGFSRGHFSVVIDLHGSDQKMEVRVSLVPFARPMQRPTHRASRQRSEAISVCLRDLDL